ncbi:TIGR04255 family protein [Nitrospira sp. T9]|uniref:TIGR04255 family protein n=1 Tax=unclassified Nitrospira TaxID=2652172 RepID=UPI003F9434D8
MHPYEGWEAFQTHIRLATNAVENEYTPPYLSRIGLRFRNIIRKSVLGLTDKDWNQLPQKKWTGDLAWSEVAGAMKATHSEVVIGLNGGDDLVCVRHGLVPIAQPIQEMGYLIDHDLFVNGQFAMTEIAGKLTEYHQVAQRFFKLWITDMLHQAMNPTN